VDVVSKSPVVSIYNLAKIVECYLCGLINNIVLKNLPEVQAFVSLWNNADNNLQKDVYKSKLISKKVSLDNYEPVRVLGKGCMGKVINYL
jgi:hypothetical protein